LAVDRITEAVNPVLQLSGYLVYVNRAADDKAIRGHNFIEGLIKYYNMEIHPSSIRFPSIHIDQKSG